MTPLLFTEQLRTSSSSLHGVSNVLVVAKLMVAFTDERVYGLALGSFYHVYLAIEQMLYEHRNTAGTPKLTTCLRDHWAAANYLSTLQLWLRYVAFYPEFRDMTNLNKTWSTFWGEHHMMAGEQDLHSWVSHPWAPLSQLC